MERRAFRFDDLALFGVIARSGSITRAATVSGIPKATVSKRLARLEASMGLLFERTHRRLEPTALGTALLDATDQLSVAESIALSTVASFSGEPQGLLRVGSPVTFGHRVLAPLVARLMDRFPRLSFEMRLSQVPADPMQEGLDLAIAVSVPSVPRLIVRRIADIETALFVQHAYASRFTEIEDVLELPRFALASPGPRTWQLTHAGQVVEIASPINCMANDPDMLARILGAAQVPGVALLPSFLAAEHPQRLQRVLAGWKCPAQPIYALMPPGRPSVPSVRAFLDELTRSLASTATQLGLRESAV